MIIMDFVLPQNFYGSTQQIFLFLKMHTVARARDLTVKHKIKNVDKRRYQLTNFCRGQPTFERCNGSHVCRHQYNLIKDIEVKKAATSLLYYYFSSLNFG